MAFRVRKLFGTFEKRAPGDEVETTVQTLDDQQFCFHIQDGGLWNGKFIRLLRSPVC